MIPTEIATISVKRGDNHVFALYFFLNDEVSPYDLTQWDEIKMQIRTELNQYSYLAATLSTADDSLEIENTNKLIVHLTSEVTEKLNRAGIYFYEIKLIDADGEATTVLKGKFNVELNVTQ
jgi:hypothetical protein